jgi:hypothetical protein
MTPQPSKTPSGPHCECCGRAIDPFNEADVDDGYTRCCNELVCRGEFPETYAIGDNGNTPENHFSDVKTGTVRACCNNRADVAAQARGKFVLYRL